MFQGCILLQGCQVNELTANPDEPGRHLFEIVPGEVSTTFTHLSSPDISLLTRNAVDMTQMATVRISVIQFHGFSSMWIHMCLINDFHAPVAATSLRAM